MATPIRLGDSMRTQFVTPDIAALTAFFGSNPVELDVDNGCYLYVFSQNDLTLSFSCNEIQASVQTRLSRSLKTLSCVSFEGGEFIRLIDDSKGQYLSANFCLGDSTIELLLRLHPEIEIRWSGLLD